VVERKNQTLMETIFILLTNSKLAKVFWGKTFMTTANLQIEVHDLLS
jgi:hypothetical protein